MAESFLERTKILLENPGGGLSVGKIKFDQVYAYYQHERLGKHHPHGGGPKFLKRALDSHGPAVFEGIAKVILDGAGVQAMIRGTEKVARTASKNAPIEFDTLRESDAVKVIDRGKLVYERPPARKRLSETAIKAERRRMGRGR